MELDPGSPIVPGISSPIPHRHLHTPSQGLAPVEMLYFQSPAFSGVLFTPFQDPEWRSESSLHMLPVHSPTSTALVNLSSQDSNALRALPPQLGANSANHGVGLMCTKQSGGPGVHPHPREDRDQVCGCKRSRCLKKYCECFAANKLCGDRCMCIGCENSSQETLRSRKNHPTPDPPRPYVKKTGESRGCRCVKSRCVKKYCDCFQAGVKCGADCFCVHCLNQAKPENTSIGTAKGSPMVKRARTRPPPATTQQDCKPLMTSSDISFDHSIQNITMGSCGEPLSMDTPLRVETRETHPKTPMSPESPLRTLNLPSILSTSPFAAVAKQRVKRSRHIR